MFSTILLAALWVVHAGGAEAQGPATEVATASTWGPDALVADVLAANPSLVAAQAGLDALEHRIDETRRLADPMLELSTAPLSLLSADVPVGFTVGLSQRLPAPGSRAAAQGRARAEAAVERGDLQALRQALAQEARRLHARLWQVEAALGSNAEEATLLVSLGQAVADRYAIGQASPTATLDLELRQVGLQSEALALEGQARSLRARINGLLHRPAAAPLPPADLGSLDAPASPAPRPELAMAQARIDGAAASLDRAQAERRPGLSWMSQYSTMWPMAAHRWMVGAGVELPLQQQPRRAALDAARAEQRQAEAAQAQLRDQLAVEAELARTMVDEARQRLILEEQRRLPLALARVDATRIAYGADQADVQALLEAAADLTGARRALDAARADLALGLAELAWATGSPPLSAETGGPR